MTNNDIEEREFYSIAFEKYQNLLTQTQKQALYLHLFEDLSYSEIAKELATSRSAAFDAVKKAKQKLLKFDKKISD
ncbi:sigma factor-like helix-turn-helix DNA-binding protein [Mycoplasma zalophi]|uniref:Sigma-70 family RNA polymerase sigma factor n=1 Tax=Mycoplasma zalophi TaxID=191287 RepID=A0ABS6DPC1_9MOLU|nr:sigma factor-like helix-turn-helix DNA-binding protein [Mycoplasma zalophi]MBU4691051.1 hypothetical protein [Mycoplasma zalophi]MBU4692169.1 hypothetical protein [Mycoplasma zalophi]